MENSRAADLGLLQTLFAAQAEVLRGELQAFAASRLEEVVQPLRNMVVALQGWTVQVSGLLERMEAVSRRSGSFPAINLPPELLVGEAEGNMSLVPADANDHNEVGLAGCSSEILATVGRPVDVSPAIDHVLSDMEIQGEEEQTKIDKIVASSNGMDQSMVALPSSMVVEVPPLVSSLLMHASGEVSKTMSCALEESLGDIGLPQGPTSTPLLDEFLSSFSCTAPRSLLQAPIHVQIEGGSSCSKRRSGRLDQKNKNCNIPTAMRAEHRLAEAYGDLPKATTSKKATEADLEEKIQSYLRMYKKPPTPVAMQAIRALVEVNV